MKQFLDIAAFLRFMQGMPERLDTARHVGLERAGQIVQAEAMEELGTYQGAAGPFAEWAPLADSTKTERVELGFSADEPGYRTGELRHHIDLALHSHMATVGVPHETVGDGTKANPMRDIGAVAIDFELGTERIPPRSFLGGAAVRKTHEVVDAAAGAVAAVLAGHDPKQAARHGERAAADSVFDIPF